MAQRYSGMIISSMTATIINHLFIMNDLITILWPSRPFPVLTSSWKNNTILNRYDPFSNNCAQV